MFHLRVVVYLLSVVALTESATVKCAIRPPPETDVVPFKPQPPAKYKDCEASTHACFYFRYHGSRISRDFPIHGCSLFDRLPPECKSGANFYEPNFVISIRGVKYTGSIKCCSNDYCNELEEAMFVPVHFNHEEAGTFKEIYLLPILLTVFVSLIFWEYLPEFTKNIRVYLRMEETEGAERPAPLPTNLRYLNFEENADPTRDSPHVTTNVTGFFLHFQQMLETIRLIEKWDNEKETAKENNQKREDRREKKAGKKKHDRVCNKKDITFNATISNRQASEHFNTKVFRDVPSRLTDLLSRLIEHGPHEFPFDPNELGDLFDIASEVLAEEPSVVEIDCNVHVIGNVEGSYIDLFRWFTVFGWPPKEKYVFLGGAIHPENPYSLEVLALLLALKVKMPSKIYLIRGYAEGQQLMMGDRFPPRVSDTLREVAAKALTRLPLAVLINKQILCIHSSLPNGITTVEEINQIRRPLVSYHRHSLEAYLLDAVPDDALQKPMEDRDNPMEYVDELINKFRKKGSLMFLPKDLDATAKRLNLDLIIRAKSVCSFGISALTGSVLSLWSAQAVDGSNAGAGILIDDRACIGVTRIFKNSFFNEDVAVPVPDVLTSTVATELADLELKGKDQLDGLPVKKVNSFYQ